MGQQNNLAAAIAYFEEQAELSPFAAQVAKWLTELKWHKERIAQMNTRSDEPLDWRPPKFTEIHTSTIVSHLQTASGAW